MPVGAYTKLQRMVIILLFYRCMHTALHFKTKAYKLVDLVFVGVKHEVLG